MYVFVISPLYLQGPAGSLLRGVLYTQGAVAFQTPGFFLTHPVEKNWQTPNLFFVFFFNRTLIDNSAYGTEKVLACINISIIMKTKTTFRKNRKENMKNKTVL